jgi:hypothetical protein
MQISFRCELLQVQSKFQDNGLVSLAALARPHLWLLRKFPLMTGIGTKRTLTPTPIYVRFRG